MATKAIYLPANLVPILCSGGEKFTGIMPVGYEWNIGIIHLRTFQKL